MAFSELIALYLFLGGTSAGAFAVMSVLNASTLPASLRGIASKPRCHADVRRERFTRELSRIVYGASFFLLIAGLMCLLADLGKPEAFYYLFLFPTSSFMSIGSFALALLALCMMLALAESSLDLGRAWKRVASIARLAGIVLSAVVMLYTGMLLKTVISVDVWQSWWLPVLFLLSALSCGIALIVLAGVALSAFKESRALTRRLAIADGICVALEACATAGYALSLAPFGTQSPFDALAFGDQAWLFWLGFVSCGLAAPLIADSIALALRREHGIPVVAAVAVLVLAGGIALRFAIVGAGIQTAV